MSAAVRVRVQVAGEVLLGVWQDVPGRPVLDEAGADNHRLAVVESLDRAARAGGVFGVAVEGGTRWVAGRAIEWAEVEVRRQ